MLTAPAAIASTCLQHQQRQLAATVVACFRATRPALTRQYAQSHNQQISQPENRTPPLRSFSRDDEILIRGTSTPRRRLRRINGRLHVEASEPLRIKSMGKHTELLILKDVTEPKDEPSRTRIDTKPLQTSTEKKPAKLSLSLFEKKRPLTQSEVFAAIDEHRPSDSVLSHAAFLNKIKALFDSFSIKQLRLYLRLRTAEGGDLPLQPPTGPAHGITNVKRGLWHAFDTAHNDLPSDATKPQPPKKHEIAERIVRRTWGIQTDQEANAPGLIELFLTADQWALLHTRDALTLFAIMRSRTFFRQSRLEVGPENRILKVIGPVSEANAIAQLISAAFADAQTKSINLRKVLYNHTNRAKRKLSQPLMDFAEERLSKEALKQIMTFTKTHMVYDTVGSKLMIYAFHKTALDDATRHVVAVLVPPSRQHYSLLSTQLDKCALVPIHVASTLSSSIRAFEYSRRVTPELAAPDASHHEIQNESKAIEKIERLLQQGSQAMAKLQDSTAATDCKGYWYLPSHQPTLRATLGMVLHSTGHVGPKRSSADRNRVFSHQPPNLPKVLSHFVGVRGSPPLPKQLVLNLMPSPLESQPRVLVSECPKIELLLNIQRRHKVSQEGLDDAAKDKPKYVYDIDDETSMTLLGARAILHQHHVDVACPSRIRDLRFTAQQTVQADVEALMNDSEVAAFVRSTIESVRAGSELRAPDSVNLRLERWMLQDPEPSRTSAKGPIPKTNSKGALAPTTEVLVKYLFAGVEHRERRRLSPGGNWASEMSFAQDHVVEITDVEAGVLGGRRTVFAIRHLSDQVASTTTGLVSNGSQESKDMLDKHLDGSESKMTAAKRHSGMPTVESAFAMLRLADAIHKGRMSVSTQQPKQDNQPGGKGSVVETAQGSG